MHLHEVGERSLFWEISFHLPWIEGYPFYHPSLDNHWKLRLKQQWMKSQRNLQRESTMLGSDWLTLQTRQNFFSPVDIRSGCDSIVVSNIWAKSDLFCQNRTEEKYLQSAPKIFTDLRVPGPGCVTSPAWLNAPRRRGLRSAAPSLRWSCGIEKKLCR